MVDFFLPIIHCQLDKIGVVRYNANMKKAMHNKREENREEEFHMNVVVKKSRDDLATALAIDAIRQGNGGFTVSATLSADNPETLEGFKKFKAALLMAHDRGATETLAIKGLLAELVVQLDRKRNHRSKDGNAPGHSHSVAGVWDADNGAIAGKPCALCALYNLAGEMGLAKQ